MRVIPVNAGWDLDELFDYIQVMTEDEMLYETLHSSITSESDLPIDLVQKFVDDEHEAAFDDYDEEELNKYRLELLNTLIKEINDSC